MYTAPTSSWLGPYRLDTRIATGGMAEVYAGRRVEEDGTVGPVVAVKRLLPHLVAQRHIVQMFLNEARITAQIRHPNVVQVHELGLDGGEPYLAMELLDGHTFNELRQRAAEAGRRVPLGITLRVLTEACQGLDAAHRATDEEGRFLGVVHRDFTPDNIHIDVQGRVRVIDFGIAKAERMGAGTEPGTLKGKFFYMSPEMIAGKPVDHRADLFAAGVMLYEQVCGRRPFTGHTPDEVLDRIAEGRPTPPTTFNPSVPPGLELICLTALSRDPAGRFASLQEFIAAIAGLGGEAEVATAEELAAYLESLFPAEGEPRRLALRQAAARASEQQLTPRSFVRHPTGAPAAVSDPAPLPLTAGDDPQLAAASTRASGSREGVAPAASESSAALALPGGAPGGNSRSRSWGKAARIGGLVLAFHVVVAAWALWPSRAPAERLAAAARLDDRSAREAELVKLAEDPQSTPEQLASAARLLLEVDGFVGLETVARALGERAPDNVEAILWEAQAAIELRMGRKAEEALDRAARLAPDEPRVELLRAELRERQGDSAGALEALARVYSAGKRPEVALRYGVLLSQSGRLEEASAVLGRLGSDAGEGRAQAELAFVRYRQERFSEARSLLQRTVRNHPRLVHAHHYLGAVLYRLADLEGAEQAYREADKLEPGDPRHLAALCEMLGRTPSRGAKATEIANALKRRFPDQVSRIGGACLTPQSAR